MLQRIREEPAPDRRQRQWKEIYGSRFNKTWRGRTIPLRTLRPTTVESSRDGSTVTRRQVYRSSRLTIDQRVTLEAGSDVGELLAERGRARRLAVRTLQHR